MMKKILLLVALVATSAFTFGQTGPTTAWVTQPPATIEMGTAYELSADYDAGDDGAGTEYEVGNASDEQFLQFSIQLYTGTSRAWAAGQNDASTLNTHSGNSTISYTIPTTLTPTADLDADQYYVMRVGYQNSNGVWSTNTVQEEIPVTITAAPVADSIAFDPETPTFSADTSLTINFTYTSDTDIPAGGIRLTYWTTIDNPGYCDVWRGTAVTSDILNAGENMPGSITITNFSAAVTTEGTIGGTIMTTDEINANQVNSGESDYPGAGSVHYWQLRLLDANTSDDYSISQILTSMVITEAVAASVEDVALSHIKVYPNPTSDFINISDLTDIETISIHNILGKEVKSFKAQKTIDISNLSTGIYYLQTNNGLKRKIIKQ